jgi:ADP-ribose pyrophosphatase YjhB (NUDIX family)
VLVLYFALCALLYAAKGVSHNAEKETDMKKGLACPHCGELVSKYRNPLPTVDIIIELEDKGIVLIHRAKEPDGWAIPGGFVDYGESLEEAARREAREETSLDVELLGQLGAYSAPDRDPRHHTITVVFLARAGGEPKARDDAREVGVFTEKDLPSPLAFDHAQILTDYFDHKRRQQ